MDTDDITTEMLQTLYERVVEFAKIKWGTDADSIILDENGILKTEELGYERGDETYQYIAVEDLSADLDKLIEERKQRDEEERKKQEEQNRLYRLRQEKMDKENRRLQFLKLKKEFE